MEEVKSWVRWSGEDASATGCSPPRCLAGPAWQGVRSEEEDEDHFFEGRILVTYRGSFLALFFERMVR